MTDFKMAWRGAFIVVLSAPTALWADEVDQLIDAVDPVTIEMIFLQDGAETTGMSLSMGTNGQFTAFSAARQNPDGTASIATGVAGGVAPINWCHDEISGTYETCLLPPP
jgi:hypothetical protein